MRGGARSSWMEHSRPAIRAAVALFVLFTIAADLTADSRCHPLAPAQARIGMWASVPSGDQDRCASGCVADCYCCSHSVARGQVILTPDGGRVTLLLPPLPTATPAGVHPLPYRPPLDLA